MRIGCVIVHYGDKETTKKAVSSFLSHEENIQTLIVVNNDKEELSSSDFGNKKVEVVNNQKNLGFAKAVNIGIKMLENRVDGVLLLNNDTKTVMPILSSLSEVFKKDSSIGIVGPAIKFHSRGKTIYDIGGNIDGWCGKTFHTEVEKLTSASTQSVEYISGCCMLIRSEVFKQIGYFNEEFFLYYEDVDFCLRAKKAGFLTTVDTRVWIEHSLSKSVGKLTKVALTHQIKSAEIFGKLYFNSGIKKVLHQLFLLYQVFTFTLKAKKGYALQAYLWSKK